MFLGKLYFTWRRYFRWIFNLSVRYASTFKEVELPYIVSSHKTPLYRQLRNVDMWLQENKVTNLKLACGKLNRIILKSGETFSFWRLVGKPTKAKGFLKGMVLTNGSFSAGVGGGLCQLSNLIYWMTLHTPLTVTERWRHTHDVFPDANRIQPFGSGATIVYNYIDLQIKNNTPHEYQLNIRVGENDLEGEWRCEQPCLCKYKVYESEHLIRQEWWGDYMRHNVIRRIVLDDNDNKIADEFITENHAIMMYEPMLGECYPKGAKES
ncbi:MAG TPA: VanW family protein [Clostridiales bacterium]|nr:VanW family protein [Clostridiales bacterium]